jgi:flagellin
MKTTAANGTDTALALTQVTAGATAANSQITILSLSDTYNVLQNGDTITYTIDGKAASATIQSSQAPDGTWSMTGVTPASARGVLGDASGVVELTFVDNRTLKLTGTTGFGFEVGNIQVTRGIAADIGKTDISSFATATAALSVLDGSVASVNMKRAELGATANRLEYAADNMSQVAMNARQSRSRVEDADYAKETTELARTQIIQQAGTAMLAQANQSAQNVLKLLQ